MPFLEWLLKYICLVCGYNYRSIELNDFSGPGPTGRRAADPEPERGRMYCDIACVCVSGSGERTERREGRKGMSSTVTVGMSLTQRDFKMEITVTAAV